MCCGGLFQRHLKLKKKVIMTEDFLVILTGLGSLGWVNFVLFGLLHDPVYSPSVVLIIFIFKATTLYPSKRKNSDKEGEFYFRFVICSS